ncbi:MAG: hypothetical protein AB8G23_12550 [Myxococcota bacterium]
MDRFLGWMLCCLMVGTIGMPSFASAQEEGAGQEMRMSPSLQWDEGAESAGAPADPELEARLRELRLARSQVSLQGPRRAQLAGGIMLGVGVFVAALAGATCAAADENNGTRCREGRAQGLMAGGGVVGGIGLITLISGMSNLGARTQEIREYDEEIDTLIRQREQQTSRVDARLSVGDENMLTLSWRF